MTAEEKKLSDAVNFYITHSIIDIDGETMTLGDAIRKLRGGNYLATKWRKCSEGQPETPRNALVVIDGVIHTAYWDGYAWKTDYYTIIDPMPEWWMNLPLLPKPEEET